MTRFLELFNRGELRLHRLEAFSGRVLATVALLQLIALQPYSQRHPLTLELTVARDPLHNLCRATHILKRSLNELAPSPGAWPAAFS